MKYTVTVVPSINCSSSGHYHGNVQVKSENKIDTRYLDFNGMRLLYHTGNGHYKGYPKYVYSDIVIQLLEFLNADELEVYEYDREGNMRYEELLYHNPEELDSEIRFYFSRILDVQICDICQGTGSNYFANCGCPEVRVCNHGEMTHVLIAMVMVTQEINKQKTRPYRETRALLCYASVVSSGSGNSVITVAPPRSASLSISG